MTTIEAEYISISKAQIDCVGLIASGKTSREISSELGIALNEVEMTLGTACRRLGVRTYSNAAIIYAEIGVI